MLKFNIKNPKLDNEYVRELNVLFIRLTLIQPCNHSAMQITTLFLFSTVMFCCWFVIFKYFTKIYFVTTGKSK